MTENNIGWILYDGQCRLCRGFVARTYRTLRRRGFRFAALQAAWVRERFALPEGNGEALREMRLCLPDGRILGGADAVIQLARWVWWAWPLWLLGFVPGGRRILRAGYEWIAARRNCLNGACAVRRNRPTHLPEQSKTRGFFELP